MTRARQRRIFARVNSATRLLGEAGRGLGDRFLTAVLDTIDRIALNPKGYAKVIREARRAEVEKFPYSVWFKVKDDVLVIACLHGSREGVARLAHAGRKNANPLHY